MKYQKPFFVILSIAVVLTLNVWGNAHKMNLGTLKQEIAAANAEFIKAFSNGDAAALAELYTEKAQLLPPNSDFVRGKEAIQAFWQGAIDMGVKQAQLEIVEVEDHGDTAIEVSKFQMLDAEGQVLDYGKYVVIWKKIEGKWKLHCDIFNSSKPAK